MEALTDWIIAFGYFGVVTAVFAESGLLFGIFLPGDTLLFTVGLLASQGFFNIYILIPLLFIAAVVGDSVGYAIGRKFGPPLFAREDSFFFKKRYLKKTEQFYERYGKKTILLARFIPIIRTIAPTLAGTARMPYATFLSYNIIGGFLWAVGVTYTGYWLGGTFSWVGQYLEFILLGIIALSFAPVAVEMIKARAGENPTHIETSTD